MHVHVTIELIICALHDQDGRKRIIKPRALDIIWGSDNRYWRIPGPSSPTDPVELLQVSWLEVTGSLSLSDLEKNQDYKVSFRVRLKPDAFGWAGSPVYLMVKIGKKGACTWKKADLSRLDSGKITDIPLNAALTFRVPGSAPADEKIYFGMYEIWKGRWKGGLVIHEVVIEPLA